VDNRNTFIVWRIFLILAALLLLADGAHAYASPGAPVELASYVLGMAAWLGIAFSALFLYPLYALLRRVRRLFNSGQAVATAIPNPAQQVEQASHS
jgi:hypothetical protein